MDRDEVRAHLTGIISSIATPFNRDGSVDYDGLRNQIDFVLAGGSRTVLLTAGDSHYICMSEAEIAEVTRVTCEHTAGRGMVVAADRYYDTRRSVAFASFAKELGADVLMVLPPNWGPSCTVETMVEHYGEVSRTMPVMIVTGAFSAQGAEFGLEVIDRTLDRFENVVAIKDDMCGDFARRLCLVAHERVAVFAGGTEGESHQHVAVRMRRVYVNVYHVQTGGRAALLERDQQSGRRCGAGNHSRLRHAVFRLYRQADGRVERGVPWGDGDLRRGQALAPETLPFVERRGDGRTKGILQVEKATTGALR